MGWRSRRQEQEAFKGMIRLVCAGLVIGAAIVMLCVAGVETLAQKGPDAAKMERLREAAAIQGRWEANARARAEAQP